MGHLSTPRPCTLRLQLMFGLNAPGALDIHTSNEGCAMENYTPRVRDIEAIDSDLRLVGALRLAARERGGPLPSIDAADSLLDERQMLALWPWRNCDIRPR